MSAQLSYKKLVRILKRHPFGSKELRHELNAFTPLQFRRAIGESLIAFFKGIHAFEDNTD